MNNLTVFPNRTIGVMKPIHGIGNGPLSRGNSMDVTDYLMMIRPPFARLHDTGYPISREVDVHSVFPDFSADENDPGNYEFFLTDKYLESILDMGTKVIYRLGETISPGDDRRYAEPPKDYSKYARICVNIIRHCNDGWADGHDYGIRYWEIWNEPSVINMWTGTTSEWLELYREIYTAIKEYDADIQIGGPVACEPNSTIHLPFLEYINKYDIKPDFYSFHCYTRSRKHAYSYLDSMYEKLDRFNLTDLPAFITEWNYVPSADDGTIFWEVGQVDKRKLFPKMINEEGAAHVAMFLGMLQDSFVAQANYYCTNTDSRFSCFTKYGTPEKPFYSLVAFGRLYKLGNQVLLTGNDSLDEAYAVAASDGKTCRVMVANLNCSDSEFRISIEGSYMISKILKIDADRNLDEDGDYRKNDDIVSLDVNRNSVAMIEILLD